MSKTKIDIEKGKVRRGILNMSETLKLKFCKREKIGHIRKEKASEEVMEKDMINQIDSVMEDQWRIIPDGSSDTLVNIQPVINF